MQLRNFFIFHLQENYSTLSLSHMNLIMFESNNKNNLKFICEWKKYLFFKFKKALSYFFTRFFLSSSVCAVVFVSFNNCCYLYFCHSFVRRVFCNLFMNIIKQFNYSRINSKIISILFLFLIILSTRVGCVYSKACVHRPPPSGCYSEGSSIK